MRGGGVSPREPLCDSHKVSTHWWYHFPHYSIVFDQLCVARFVSTNGLCLFYFKEYNIGVMAMEQRKQIGVLQTPIHQQDPEEEVLAILAEVREYVRKLAMQTQDPDLNAINVNELSEEDVVFLRRFILDELTLEEIERQEIFLAGMREGNTPLKEGTPLKEADTSLRLLAYMRKKLMMHSSVRH